MRRLLFNSLCAISLLLCIATAGLWVRSYWVADRLRHIGHLSQPDRVYRVFDFASACGTVALATYLDDSDPPEDPYKLFEYDTDPITASDRKSTSDYMRFGITLFGTGHMGPMHSLAFFPAWLLTLMFSILPAFWLLRRRRAARRKQIGCCGVCGYDLRATPDRCPECGAAAGVPHSGQRSGVARRS